MIKGLQTRMAILGHIKIGGKKRIKNKEGREVIIPEKYDHFVVTTTEQNELGYLPDEALMQKLMTDQLNMLIADHIERIYDETGKLIKTIQTIDTHELADKNPKLKRILVALPFDDPDQNLVTSLALYDQDGCRCRGDGESADFVDPRTGEVTKVHCPCDMFLNRLGPYDDPSERKEHAKSESQVIKNAYGKGYKCKANGNLRVMIAKAKTLGGIHQFRTTSINSITQLMAAMNQVSEITGGFLSAIPMLLEISSKKVSTGPNKQPRTVHVVTLTHRASINDFLREVAEQTALREKMRKQIAAKEILELPPPGKEDHREQMMISQEFYTKADEYIDVDSEDVEESNNEEPPPKEEARKTAPESAPEPEEASTASEPVEKTKAPEASEPTSDPSTGPETHDEAKEENNSDDAPETPSNGMPQINIDPPDDADTNKASKEQRKEFFQIARKKYSDDEIRNWLKELWNIESSSRLLVWQINVMMEAING